MYDYIPTIMYILCKCWYECYSIGPVYIGEYDYISRTQIYMRINKYDYLPMYILCKCWYACYSIYHRYENKYIFYNLSYYLTSHDY